MRTNKAPPLTESLNDMTQAHKIVFLDRETLSPDIHVRKPSTDHDWQEFGLTQPDQTADRLTGATIAITNKVALNGKTLEQLPGLKMIAVAATGTNMIDLEACQKQGIVVSNITDYAGHSVPEHVFSLMLMLMRNIKGYEADLQDGAWQKSGKFCFFSRPVHDLHGKRLGIFGRGALGQAVGNMARCFGMDVVYAGRKGQASAKQGYLPFDEVLATSHALTFHMPLMPDTENLIGQAEFSLMAQKPVIINTARGGIVNEPALVRALESWQISGAGFDVVTAEPPAPDHPFMALAKHPNFILTPHMAWASHEAMQTLADQLIDNIEGFMAGKPRNKVLP